MIGIRSARLDADGATITLRAGGGIVAGSDPEAEAAETNVKLATVLDAVVPGRLSAAAVNGRALRWLAGTAACRRALAASGILTSSVAPPGGEVATSADPCRASAMARTMASPSPVPVAEREGSPW